MSSVEMASREPAPRSSPSVSKPATPTKSLLWPGALGFVAGAICWHLVGFWGFVKEAVFFSRTDATNTIGTRASGAPMKSQNRQPGSAAAALAASAETCSVAVRSREGTESELKPCAIPAFKFQRARNIVKSDRGDFGPTPVPTLISGSATPAPAVSGWMARVEAGETAKAPNP